VRGWHRSSRRNAAFDPMAERSLNSSIVREATKFGNYFPSPSVRMNWLRGKRVRKNNLAVRAAWTQGKGGHGENQSLRAKRQGCNLLEAVITGYFEEEIF